MPLIHEQDREGLRKLAEAMTKDVSLTLYTQHDTPLVVPGVFPCETCNVTEELMGELTSLMPRLALTVRDLVADRVEAMRDGVDRAPTMLFDGDAGGRVSFVGMPGGYEFPAFVTSVLELGGIDQGLTPEMREKVAAVDQPISLKVFVTPT